MPCNTTKDPTFRKNIIVLHFDWLKSQSSVCQHYFTLVSCFPHSCILKMEAAYYFETSVTFNGLHGFMRSFGTVAVTNWKGFERKRMRCSRDSILAIFWRDTRCRHRESNRVLSAASHCSVTYCGRPFFVLVFYSFSASFLPHSHLLENSFISHPSPFPSICLDAVCPESVEVAHAA
jgi:hypothetical protein